MLSESFNNVSNLRAETGSVSHASIDQKKSRLTIFCALADHPILLLDMLDLGQITDPTEVRGNSAHSEEESDTY